MAGISPALAVFYC